jgi:hypothetical protein
MHPSAAAKRFRARLLLVGRLRRISPETILTIASLLFLGVGLAWISSNPGWSFILVGGLLALLTPVGAAMRILIRGH